MKNKGMFYLVICAMLLVGGWTTPTSPIVPSNTPDGGVEKTSIASTENALAFRATVLAATETAVAFEKTRTAFYILQTQSAQEGTAIAISNFQTQAAKPTNPPPSSTPIPNTATFTPQPSPDTSTTTTITPTPNPNPTSITGNPWNDDFSTNKGWDLSTDENGTVRRANDQLIIKPTDGRCRFAKVPHEITSRDFYFKVDVFINNTYSRIGLAIGPGPGAYFAFTASQVSGFKIGTYQGNSFSESESVSGNLWAPNSFFTFGLEAIAGKVEAHINDQETWEDDASSAEIGGFALMACDMVYFSETEVRFDNLEIRESK